MSGEFGSASPAEGEASLDESISEQEATSLNAVSLDDLKDGALVRFRGMIQDMHNPEYFLRTFEVLNKQTQQRQTRSGLYKDAACHQEHEEILMDSDKTKHGERQTLVVISVPGLNDWAREKPTSSRLRATPTATSSGKRPLEESEPESMDTSPPLQKKDKPNETASGPETKTVLSKEHFLNFPIPIRDGKCCIVKVYDEVQYKLNTIIDIVGYISLDPTLSLMSSDEEAMDDAEVQTHNPPTSLVPRIHAVKVTEVRDSLTESPEILSRAQAIRGDLHMVLSQLLFGDTLVANYLICHLISGIYMRKDFLALGNFPLNITKFPVQKYPQWTTDFYEILSKLVPKSHYFECTLDALNDLSIVPKKDYVSNRLTSGVLQLTDNTHLVIDETKLSAGKLSPAGQKNYQAIDELIRNQEVKYDFQFYPMDYHTDIPVLILSESKSFLPVAIQTPVKVDPETEKLYAQVVEAAGQYLKDQNRLNDIRQYLQTLRRTKFDLEESVLDVIQQDFVELRRTNEAITADNLHTLMVLTRFMSLSYGQTSLTLDCWKKTLDMELERLSRLPRKEK